MIRTLLGSALLLLAAPLLGAAPPDPLRLIPKDANLIVSAPKPRALIDAITSLDAYRGYEALPQVKAVLDSAPARRAFAVVKLLERELGAKWPELLDSIAGGGIALGTVAGMEPAPAVLVVQGKDAKESEKAFRLMLKLFSEEASRGSPEDKPISFAKTEVKGGTLYHMPDAKGDFHTAITKGGAILISNKAEALKAALLLDGGDSSASALSHKTLPAARKLLGGDPLAWLWFDLVKAKEQKGTKDFLESARKELFSMLTTGSIVDAVRRSDFVAAGFFRTDTGLKLSVRLPAKRADLLPEFALHVPLEAGKPGSLPLLEPENVVYSQSFYLDLATLWTDRKRILNPDQLKETEKFEKDISKLLPGKSFGKLLEMTGPHHRIVAIERGNKLYSIRPEQPLPEMALVSSMRDPEFGPAAEAAIRIAGLLASLQFQLKMSEATTDGIRILSYRFPEDGVVAADAEKLRFNFEPSFAVVNGFFVAASSRKTIEALIPVLKKPAKPSDNSPAVWRNRVYGDGAAAFLRAHPETLLASAILQRGLGLTEAKAEIEQLAKALRNLGTAGMTLDHAADSFRFDVEWQIK